MSTAVEEEVSSDADASSADSAGLSDGDGSAESDASSDNNSLEASESSDRSSGSTTSEPRPRFQGFKSKWLKYTRPERDLVASLDALEADDLSIHLYNTHALKRRLRPAANTEGSIKQTDRKSRWISESNKDQWVPRAKWTAWPLEAERVPRSWENFSRSRQGYDEDPDAIKPARKGRPTSKKELEECIVADTLRQARERFYATRDPAPDQSREGEEPPRKKQKTTVADASESSSSAESDNDELFPATDLHEGLSADAANMMDEEEAQELLQPATRRIMDQFDELLRALHHSRHNHIYYDPHDSGSERGQGSNDPDSVSGGESTQTSSNSLKGGRTETGVARMLPRLNPRDWSEVLGTAAIVGWDANVVQRAAARCSELFGESMTFNTLYEDVTQKSKPNESMSQSGDPAPDSEANASKPDAPPARRVLYEPGVGPIVCPIRSCRRYKTNFRNKSYLVHHMKRQHGFDDTKYDVLYADDDYEPSESSADEMHGGVHVDGFLKPIKLQTAWYIQRRRRKRPDSSTLEDLERGDEFETPGTTGEAQRRESPRHPPTEQVESDDAMRNYETEDDTETGNEITSNDETSDEAAVDDETSNDDTDNGTTSDDSTRRESLDDSESDV